MVTRQFDEDLDLPLFLTHKWKGLLEGLKRKIGQALWNNSRAENERYFPAYFNFVVREIKA
jgi:hypothetical protein